MINEQNPPPFHLAKAEDCRRLQISLLMGCLVILGYLLIALDTENMFFLLFVLVFMALPLTLSFFMIDTRIKRWERPYQLYSQEFGSRPRLKSGIQVPIRIEYQFPSSAASLDILQRLHAIADSALQQSFSSNYIAADYEETRDIVVRALEPEIEKLGIAVFRVHIAKIEFSPIATASVRFRYPRIEAIADHAVHASEYSTKPRLSLD